MYVNKCIKCGAEFETKNPKRVICPNCLYADKGSESSDEKPMQSYSSYSSYSTESRPRSYERPQQGGYRNNNYQRRDNRGGQQGGYQRRDNNRPQRRPDNRGGFRNNYASARPQGPKRPMQKKSKPARPLLISKEQLEQIEVLYKAMLPLPNPDAHEVIGAKLGIEPQKVFFGINLVRQKLMLPKLPFPKRKLAISPDQMMAIKALYEPLLPLPPIGCHKIIAAQLKMDEWRVHVGIKLIRAQMGLGRWNEDRADKPADYMVAKHTRPSSEEKIPVAVEAAKPDANAEEPLEAAPEVVEEKPKRGRKPKKKEDEE